jgi:hypothetical protein
MKKLLGIAMFAGSVLLFSANVYGQMSCLLGDLAKQVASKAGIPTSYAAALFQALTSESTAEASIDQVTQLSVVFADKNAGELNDQDKNYAKAIDAVKAMPLTEANQNCIEIVEKTRTNIKRKLVQRGKENVPPAMTPNQFNAAKQKQ